MLRNLAEGIELPQLQSPISQSASWASTSQSPNDETKVHDDLPGFHYCLPEKLRWFEDNIKNYFTLDERRVNIKSEFIAGVVQFLSCSYVIVVIPGLLVGAGYPVSNVFLMSCVICCIGSIASGVIDNIPFIVAPSTSGSLLLSVYLRQNHMTYQEGNQAVVLLGCAKIFLGLRPVCGLFSKLVPRAIQASIAIGMGIMTSLAGCTESRLVVRGKYSIVAPGENTPLGYITMFGVIIIAICLHFHIKGAFSIALVFCSIAYWANYHDWPDQVTSTPHLVLYKPFATPVSGAAVQLFMNLIFLQAVSLIGLAKAFSDLAGISTANGIVPRGRWLYTVTGMMCIFSGFFSGPAVGVCPESGAGIKAGARTGLSSVFCGCMFGISVFFVPLLSHIPYAGTAPLLIAIGCVLFENVKKVDWTDYKNSYPAYITLFFIPFNYSIIRGALYGWISYLILHLISGDLYVYAKELARHYTPTLPWRDYFQPTYIASHIWHDVFQFDDSVLSSTTASRHHTSVVHHHFFVSYDAYDGNKHGRDLSIAFAQSVKNIKQYFREHCYRRSTTLDAGNWSTVPTHHDNLPHTDLPSDNEKDIEMQPAVSARSNRDRDLSDTVDSECLHPIHHSDIVEALADEEPSETANNGNMTEIDSADTLHSSNV